MEMENGLLREESRPQLKYYEFVGSTKKNTSFVEHEIL
jgi:hypothetical protein